jgi:LmbE family N-acetylglucosaminyl deacetylase
MTPALSPDDSLSSSRSRPLVVLSPHLDDAVISLGGLMAREAAAGRKVRAATAYTAYPARLADVPARFRRLLIYDRRREEDRQALARLGAEPVWLDLCERAVREPVLPRLLGVLSLPSPASLDDFPGLPALCQTVERLASGFPAPIVAVPLAIGGHVDHVEVFLASALVMLETRAFDQFLFYEDVYAMSARLRRRHFLAARHRWPLAMEPALTGPTAAVMLTAMGVASRGPRPEDYLPALRTSLVWQCEPIALSGFEEAKLEAIRLYTSQTERLGGSRAFAAMVTRWHAACGGTEFLWKAAQL